MDWHEILSTLFNVVLIPALGLLTTYAIKLITAKCTELMSKSDNALHDKYIQMLNDTVVNCVLATTQTYVEALKKQNAFDGEAQKEAFLMTKNAVLAILSQDALNYLRNSFDDFEVYLTNLIESQVFVSKV